MAVANVELIGALRATAARLDGGAVYQWGHLGQCNCGHLVQTVCHLDKRVIHEWALERRGDWEELANDYCPTSGYAIDDVIGQLVARGMTTDDIGHLEKLDDPAVLTGLPGGHRWLRRNDRADLIIYLETWADQLEAALPVRAAPDEPVARAA